MFTKVSSYWTLSFIFDHKNILILSCVCSLPLSVLFCSVLYCYANSICVVDPKNAPKTIWAIKDHLDFSIWFPHKFNSWQSYKLITDFWFHRSLFAQFSGCISVLSNKNCNARSFRLAEFINILNVAWNSGRRKICWQCALSLKSPFKRYQWQLLGDSKMMIRYKLIVGTSVTRHLHAPQREIDVQMK